MAKHRLEFEKTIYSLEDNLTEMEAKGADGEVIRRMRKELVALKKEVYSRLTAWQTILVARHPERPHSVDYLDLIFEDFVELHGDRAIGDDRAIRTGFARLGDYRVMFLGHQKGHTVQERNLC